MRAARPGSLQSPGFAESRNARAARHSDYDLLAFYGHIDIGPAAGVDLQAAGCQIQIGAGASRKSERNVFERPLDIVTGASAGLRAQTPPGKIQPGRRRCAAKPHDKIGAFEN